jgi:hypothetical protein
MANDTRIEMPAKSAPSGPKALRRVPAISPAPGLGDTGGHESYPESVTPQPGTANGSTTQLRASNPGFHRGGIRAGYLATSNIDVESFERVENGNVYSR